MNTYETKVPCPDCAYPIGCGWPLLIVNGGLGTDKALLCRVCKKTFPAPWDQSAKKQGFKWPSTPAYKFKHHP
jgi:hypothetical protein